MSKETPEHFDRLNRQLSIDDCVATSAPYSSGFSIAKVVGFTPKMVKVALLGNNRRWGSSTYNRYPDDMVIVDPQAVTYYLLTKGQ